MKKRTIRRKLRLRKETLRDLDRGAMGAARGGTHTENAFCVATTLAAHCAQGTENECAPPTGQTCGGPGVTEQCETHAYCFSIPVCYP